MSRNFPIDVTKNLVVKWAGPFGFGDYKYKVLRRPLKDDGSYWMACEWSHDERWFMIFTGPDAELPYSTREATVLHELAHGLVGYATLSAAHEEDVCNRVARLLRPRVKLANEHKIMGKGEPHDIQTSAKSRRDTMVASAVDHLSNRQREVINGLWYERASVRTIAKRLGVSGRTVQRIEKDALGDLMDLLSTDFLDKPCE